MKVMFCLSACLGLTLAIGCTQQQNTNSKSDASATSVDGSKYLLNEQPAGVQEVIQARVESKDGDEVILAGRIGGASPWNDGRAAFYLVDSSLKACSDNPEDHCKTPWDYCCVPTKTLKEATALIKVVDEQGDLVKTDARELLKVKELSTVVVKGKAQRDDAGNLTVLASGIYIKKN